MFMQAACQLTIRLRYCGKRRGKDQIFQRSPSYPACCHKTAASPTPEKERSDQNIDVTRPQVLKNDTQRVLKMMKSDTLLLFSSLGESCLLVILILKVNLTFLITVLSF